MKSIFIGNLPFSATEEEISTLFLPFGTVHSVRIINDRETGRPRGFAFVKMDDSDASKAVASLNGSDFNGRSLRVNEAEEQRSSGNNERSKSHNRSATPPPSNENRAPKENRPAQKKSHKGNDSKRKHGSFREDDDWGNKPRSKKLGSPREHRQRQSFDDDWNDY